MSHFYVIADSYLQDDFGLLQITYEITGLSPGEHGFTIYQTGDIINVE